MREERQRILMAESVETGQIEILESAFPPGGPVNPRRPRLLAIGLFMGIMVGSGLSLVRESMSTSIRRLDEITSKLRTVGLAAIPNIGAAGSVRALRLSGGGKKGVGQLDHSTGMVTYYEPNSPAAESYRALRTNLIFSQASGRLKSILVTSARPGEGKSTTSSNLAITFAQQGLRTLLIDCDLRYPKQNKIFNAERKPGLTEWMRDPTLLESLRTTSIENLWLLPAGGRPHNPVEFLGSPAMAKALQTFSERFDMVVIDTCPVLAASDPLVLGTLVDGVLLVVRAGDTEQGEAKHAVDQLNTVGARVVGVVLNDPNSEMPRYGSYHYQYGNYGQLQADESAQGSTQGSARGSGAAR